MRVLTDENIFKSSYFKDICPGYEQFFESEKLFAQLSDDPAEILRRQDILRDLLDNPKLFDDLCFLLDSIFQFKSLLSDMPNHDLGDFRLNLECFEDADSAIGLLDKFLQTAEFAKKYSWLNKFAEGVNKFKQKHSAEKMVATWVKAFVPEAVTHACDFGFNFDDILWPVNYKLLALREQEYTRKNTSYRIEPVKIQMVNRVYATFSEILHNTSVSYRMEGDGQFRNTDNQALKNRDQYTFSAEALGTRSKINSSIRGFDEEFSKKMDSEHYGESYILKSAACQLLENRAAFDAPTRIKFFVTTLVSELEPLVTEFVPYICAAKTALYWQKYSVPYCIPKFGKPGEIRIQGLINPYITKNEGTKAIIENDINLNGALGIVTGANSGGKTAFVTSVTLCQLLFQLGFPVPATSAKLGIFNGIVTVFAGEEQGLIGTGRLGEELKKLAVALNAAQSGNVFVCFNEPLTGTSSFDGERILCETLCMLKQALANGFVVTHLLGIAKVLDDLNEIGGTPLITLTAQTDGDRPLYKIIHAPVAESSHAKAVVSRFIS